MNGWERNKKIKKIIDDGVDGWLHIYEERKTPGQDAAHTIPETALSLLSAHALLRESRALKWLTVLLAFLTIVLAALTWRLAFPAP